MHKSAIIRAVFELAFMLVWTVAVSIQRLDQLDAAPQKRQDSPQGSIAPHRVVVTLSDGSKLQARLAEEPIVIQTPYGRLTVPTADVRQITHGVRLTDEEIQQITKWIESLGDSDLNVRKQAAAELLAQQARAWRQMEIASQNSSAEITKELEAILDKLWETIPEDELTRNELDVVQTVDSTIVGRIVPESIRIRTTQFGELQLRLADARSLRSLALPASEDQERTIDRNAQFDPGNLKALEGRIGETFVFNVTGAGGGTIWGSNPYTTDSKLSSVVVHCGLLKEGETGVVQVRILGQLPTYSGTTKNGLTSNSYGGYPGFSIRMPKKSRPRK